jgi:hypothetical protein
MNILTHERTQFVMNILTQLVTKDKCSVTFSFLPSQVSCNIATKLWSIRNKGENALAALSEAFRHYETRRKDREKFVNKMSLLAKQRVLN